MSENRLAVEMRGIVKRFPGVLANDRVDLDVRAGEVHALLGENGAGKSTLMNILSGLYHPDEGEIYVDGAKVTFGSPKDAIHDGIGMIHQHFMLVPVLSVAENLVLGLDEARFLLRPQKIEAEVEALSQRFNISVDPRAKIWQLSVGEQQRVEVLKMLYRGANILIMDEPTAVLTPQEVEELFHTLREMASSGKTIIFISHKLHEVLEIADRISVLRLGRMVSSGIDLEGVTKKDLARLMVGREVLFRIDRKAATPGEPILEIRNLQALDDKGLPALKGISLEVRTGEILALAGVSGNGQRELAEAVTGLREATGGSVIAQGREVTNASPSHVLEAGLSFVPEDRVGMGSVPNMNISENLALRNYRIPPIGNGWVMNLVAMREQAEKLVDEFDIATPSIETPSRLLSGGNLQKLILAREISGAPAMLVAMQPTRGLDVGATEAVHRILLEQRDEGAAILMISEDLDEIMALADRIAVIYEGQIMGEMSAEGADIEEIGLMMAGTRTAHNVKAG
ncbi:MAG: ABC transporter ATP-binding protein [Anaerolineae bacterium]|nr:MAG: ABC transporter ATP-binding protein [Anaerolineae bacterium]